ncbi:porin family protein [Flavobacterium sp. UBA6135]|uniref:porin family protein n=1 Tax=Flavobacterium sp. UBA6135 TaxID=1946553 RepID=UPI0025BB08AD|nr:porin family protein [Flavobacterium sp. UBA6135]
MTKNQITSLVVVLLTTLNVAAQKVTFGAKAGLNLATLTGDVEDMKSLTGYHVGGSAEFKITEKFSVQPELLYSLEGGKSSFFYEDEISRIDTEEKMKLGYLNLPIMAKYYVADGLSLEAGPQIGYLLHANSHYDYDVNIGNEFVIKESGKEDIKDFVEKINVGINFGLGYQLKNNLFFQARYHLGLTNINKDLQSDDFEEEPSESVGKIKNSSFQFSIGYRF